VVDPAIPPHGQEPERRTPAARPAEMQLRARVPRQHAGETPPHAAETPRHAAETLPSGPAPLSHAGPTALPDEPPPARDTGQRPPSPGELNAAPTVADEGQTAPWPAEPPAFERPHSSPTPPDD